MINNILWDFDGVILDSMKVRDWGFREVLSHYPKSSVNQLIDYHQKNGGLSRYVKFRYFYEEILNKEISEQKVLNYAEKFSVLMKQKLSDKNNLIQDSLDFIKHEFKNYNFHIVSGSDQTELRFLCNELGIAEFFLTIEGSPTPKKELIENLMEARKYNPSETLLVGDSINDFEAAESNQILFLGYNNPSLIKDLNLNKEQYTSSFKNITF